MSAPVRMTPSQLRRLSTFLDDLTNITKQSVVDPVPYGPMDVSVDGNIFKVAYDQDQTCFIVADRVGD